MSLEKHKVMEREKIININVSLCACISEQIGMWERDKRALRRT